MPALAAASSPGVIVQEITCVIGGILMIFSINNPLTKLCPKKATITSTIGATSTTSSAVKTTSSAAATTISVGSTTSIVLPGGTTLTVPQTSTSASTSKSSSFSTSTSTSTSKSSSLSTSTSKSTSLSTSTSVSSTSTSPSTSSSTSALTSSTVAPSSTSTSTTSAPAPSSTSTSSSSTTPTSTSIFNTPSTSTTSAASTPVTTSTTSSTSTSTIESTTSAVVATPSTSSIVVVPSTTSTSSTSSTAPTSTSVSSTYSPSSTSAASTTVDAAVTTSTTSSTSTSTSESSISSIVIAPTTTKASTTSSIVIAPTTTTESITSSIVVPSTTSAESTTSFVVVPSTTPTSSPSSSTSVDITTSTTSVDVPSTTPSTSTTSVASISTSTSDVPTTTTTTTSTSVDVPPTTSDVASTSTTSISTPTSSSAAPTSTNYSAFSCPADLPLSCSNTTVIEDTCCFEAPGGLILQTQFWDTVPAVGPNNSWTLHGLWPDNCDSSYESNCDPSRAYTNITQILQASGDQALVDYMNQYWLPNSGTAESFWEHEWGKHGTCMSTFDTQCYPDYTPTQEVPDFFEKTVELFKTLPTYDWLALAGIVPSTTVQYTVAQFVAALQPKHGAIPYIGCTKGQVDEMWYFYHIQGSVQAGKYVPTDVVGSATDCPASFYYYPKGYSPPTASTTTKASSAAATNGPTSTAAATPFVGKGFLYPSDPTTLATLSGPITKLGKWIGGISNTPAGWTSNSTTGSGTFGLTTSAGPCGVDPVTSALTCAAAGTGPVSLFSGSINGLLMYNGSTVFGAPSAPASSGAQVSVFAQIRQDVPFVVKWSTVDLSK